MSKTTSRACVFSVVLVSYLFIAWYGQRFHGNTEVFVGDEDTYVRYANELISFVSSGGSDPLDSDVTLYSGPGFPVFLIPWMLMGFSFSAIKLLNAFLIVGGGVLLCKALETFLPERAALWVSVLTVFHPKLVWHSSMIFTEPYAFFLSALLCWLVLRPHEAGSRLWWLLPALVLSQMILTKVLFAYVAVALFVIFAAMRVFTARSDVVKPALVCAASLAFCLPFLAYSYSETGKLFYWLHSGGTNLYWMSTPYPGELGDWMGDNLEGLRQRASEGHVEFIFENHKAFFEQLPADAVARDLAFKEAGWKNIVAHPLKLAQNIVANLFRIYADHPNTYDSGEFKLLGLVDIVVGIPLMLGTAVFAVITILKFQQIPTEMLFIVLLYFVFVGGLSLLASFGRMLVPVVPMLTIWLSYMWIRCITLRYHPVSACQSTQFGLFSGKKHTLRG